MDPADTETKVKELVAASGNALSHAKAREIVLARNADEEAAAAKAKADEEAAAAKATKAKK